MYPPRPGEWVFARTRAVRRFEVEGAPPYGHGPVAAKSARGMRAAAMPRTWKKLANGRFWFSKSRVFSQFFLEGLVSNYEP